MSSTLQTVNQISEKEYLDGEKLSDVRHEYVDGHVYAMAGASKRHNTIGVNLTTALNIASRGTSCNVYSSDMKVKMTSKRSYFYPDVVVDCNDDDTDDYYLENPCLIVEVLSKSTEKRDRSEKLLSYINIPSLKAYLLVSQDRPEVEYFYRQEDGNWWVESFEGLDAILKLPCPEMELTVSEIYETVSF